ncbi:MAG: hypothetical protein GWN86_19640 [Desulfobacterales bacterium]|nr:hypothetical protein [Desulfobacterales bacterium]
MTISSLIGKESGVLQEVLTIPDAMIDAIVVNEIHLVFPFWTFVHDITNPWTIDWWYDY